MMKPFAARRTTMIALCLVGISLMVQCFRVEAACQSCLLSSAIPIVALGRQHHRHLATQKGARFPVSQVGQASMVFGVLATRQVATAWIDSRRRFAFATKGDAGGDLEDSDGSKEKTEDAEKSEVSAAMVASIGFYKRFISPLLPPACRFLPTCSQYGVQAIEQFGPSKGAILTAWRLLRCSPLGGRGYDPPKWPPVPYTYGSY